MFLELFILITFSILFYDYLYKKNKNEITSNIPAPPALPILGHAHMYLGLSPENLLNEIRRRVSEYGPVYKIWILNRLTVFSADPKDTEFVLSSNKHTEKNSLYDFLSIWLGNGLLLSSGEKWFGRRRAITPTFHFKILEQFVEIFDQQSEILVQQLKKKVGSTAFDIHPYITLEALDIISETAMGVKIYAQTDPNNEYAHAVTEMTKILSTRFVRVWLRSEWVFATLGAKMKRDQDKYLKILHSYTEHVIEERKAKIEEDVKNGIKEDGNEFGIRKKMALLDVLLQTSINGKPLSNEDIREEVDTFMFEGHDTTTTAMCFILYAISRHPRVQEKIFEEISTILGDDRTKPVKLRDLQELKYLECAIKEGLRLYPSVPMIGRFFKEDVVINGKHIPAGTNYTVGIFVALRDPKIFPNPDAFEPERHSLENSTESTNPYAYVPFSAGPRNCIGQKFAMFEMKSTISKILRYYELLPLGPDPIQMMNLVMRSANGVHLGIKERVY